MTTTPKSLLAAIGSWTSNCETNRASIGEFWDAADDLMQLHSDLLDRLTIDQKLSPPVRSALMLLNVHAIDVALALYDLTVRGLLDASAYMERALFDLCALVPEAATSESFAQRVVAGEPKLAGEARQRVPDTLQASTRTAAKRMNDLAHTSITHLLRNVVGPSNDSSEPPDGYRNVRVRAGGTTDAVDVRRQWFDALAMHAFVVSDTLAALDADSNQQEMTANMLQIMALIRDNARTIHAAGSAANNG